MSALGVFGRGLLKSMQSDQKNALIASARSGEYNLFLGAGISLDSVNGLGANLPSGAAFKDELCAITGAKSS